MNLRLYLNLLLVFFSVSLIGQTGNFRIFGTVYNTDKKIVADWPVVFIGDAAGVAVKVITDQNGNYEHTFPLNSNTRTVYQISVVDPCQNAPLVQKAAAFDGEERHDFVICSRSTPANPCDGKFESITHADGVVEFHAAPDINDAKYFWDFGDGTSGEGKDIKHQYAKEGVYVVVLIISTPNCKSQFTAKVEVKNRVTPPPPPPSKGFDNSCCGKVHISAAATNTGSSPNVYIFNAGGDFKFTDVSWDFGDGTTGTGIETKHAYAADGKYLVVTTIKGEQCTVILNTWIHVDNTVNPPPPKPCDIDFKFTNLGSTTNASSLTVRFEANLKGAKADKIRWDFGDGESSSDDPTSHTYAKAGEYKVTLYAEINGVICQITKVVKVGDRVGPPKPCNIDFVFGTSGLSAKFQADLKGATADKLNWDFGDGSSSSDAATSHTYAKEGEYKVTLTVSINGVECNVTKVIRIGARKKLDPNNSTGIVIYDVSPNPATDVITVSIKSDLKARVTLVIADVTNVSLIKQEIEVEIGDNQVPLKVDNLRAGSYVVSLFYDNRIVSRAKFQKI
jgi:PKD repeat protein